MTPLRCAHTHHALAHPRKALRHVEALPTARAETLERAITLRSTHAHHALPTARTETHERANVLGCVPELATEALFAWASYE